MTTPILKTTEVTSGQIDKYTTINLQQRQTEGVSVRVLEIRTSAPPASPADGDSYIVGSGSISGAFAAYSLNQIAVYIAGAWYAFTPIEGWHVWNNATDKIIVYTGSAWVSLPELSTGVSAFTNGSIPFITSGTFTQDNANLSYDDALNLLKALRVAWSVTSLATNTTVGATHGRNINVSGNTTLTLPAAATSSGVEYLISKTDSSATTVTIDANAAELINGQATTTLIAQYSTAYLICNGTGWNLFSSGGTAISITDNVASAFSVAEGSNNYINVVTTNGAEKVQLGNATTNPTKELLGTGLLITGGNIVAPVSASITSATTLVAATAAKYNECSDAGGSFTITLPAASTCTGLEYIFRKTNSSTNTITIDGSGAETIDGFASLLLYSQRDVLTIYSTGTEWVVKEYVASGTFSPTIVGSTTPGSHTYSATRFGKFTRIRHQVFINILCEITTKDAAMAGTVRVGGLPFACASGTENTASCSFFLVGNVNLSAGYTQFGGAVVSGQSYVAMIQLGDNVLAANLNAADVSNGTRIDLTTSYSAI